MLSAVEPRKKSLTALFIDGEFAVNIDTEIFLNSYIKPGDEISDECLHGLIEKSDARRAREKGLYLLEYRAYSQKELAEKISRSAPREAAERAARQLAEIGLVNDTEYARSRAAYLFERKGCSASRVKYELSQKGIDKDIIEQIIEETKPEPVQKIKEIIERKYPRFSIDEKTRNRAVAALQRLGYKWDDIRSALNELNGEDDFF